MSSFIPKVYAEDADEDVIKSLTPVKARKNLKVGVLEVMGALSVGKTLEIKKGGKLDAKGAITIAENLICGGDAVLNGSVTVSGEITGGDIKINGHLETKAINASRIAIKGSLKVENGIRADESITLAIKQRSRTFIGGIIEAPVVTLRAKYGPARAIVKILGIKPRAGIELRNIRIKTRKLKLENVTVEGSIEADEVEQL